MPKTEQIWQESFGYVLEDSTESENFRKIQRCYLKTIPDDWKTFCKHPNLLIRNDGEAREK